MTIYIVKDSTTTEWTRADGPDEGGKPREMRLAEGAGDDMPGGRHFAVQVRAAAEVSGGMDTHTLSDWQREMERMDDPTADSHHSQKRHGELRILIAAQPGGVEWLERHDREVAAWEADVDASAAEAEVVAWV